MDIYLALGIIAAFIVGIIVVAAILYKVQETKRKIEASKSLPKGGDSSDIGRMLQEKYRAERDNDEFKRPDFY